MLKISTRVGGLFLIITGLLALWVMHTDIQDEYTFSHGSQENAAVISNIEWMAYRNALVPGQEPMQAGFNYTYATGGRQYKQHSDGDGHDHHAGDNIQIEYLTAHPAVSRPLSSKKTVAAMAFLCGICMSLTLTGCVLAFWPRRPRKKRT